MADEILIMGVPTEVDTGFNESGHKIPKVAAGMTQRNSSPFALQTGTRLDEFQLIDLGNLEIEGSKLWDYHAKPATVKPPPPEQKTCGAQIHIFKDKRESVLLNGEVSEDISHTRGERVGY
jgi:hypothetical protein